MGGGRALSLLALCLSLNAVAAEWPALSGPAQIGGGENDAALIIGIDAYAYSPPVPGAEENAEDWYRFLTEQRRVPATAAVLLRGREGTRERIQKYASELAQQVKPGGTLWFVFIGHGAPAPDGADGVLVGHDAQQDADSLYARSVRRGELEALFASGGQERTVMVLDACFSGRTPSGQELLPGLQPLIPISASAQARALPANAVVLTAASSDQFAGSLPGLNRPAFSYLALGALRGWADRDSDGWVTGGEVAAYANDTLRVMVRGRSQTPSVSGSANEPLVKSGGERAPELAALALSRNVAPTLSSGPAPVIESLGDRVRVDLISGDASERWDVYVDDAVICTTPCTQQLDPLRPISMRTRDRGMLPVERVQLASLGTGGGPFQVQAHSTAYGKFVPGIVAASLGGMGLMTGGMLGLMGARGEEAFATAGLISAGAGAALVAGGIVLMVMAQPRAEVVKVGAASLSVSADGAVAVRF